MRLPDVLAPSRAPARGGDPVNARLVSGGPVFLDEVDHKGAQVAYIGCAPDRRTAQRMRTREAESRGIPPRLIVFTPAPKESAHA
jgi:hypothetical protein